MIPLFRPEQVRAMDTRAIDGGVASAVLMERAAGHLARTVVAVGGHGYGLRVGIVCGRGNNGGDGLAAARRLLDAGAAVRLALLADPEELSGDPALQLARWRRAGGRLAASPAEALAGCDVAVDCLLGTGATGAPRGPLAAGVAALNDHAARSHAAVVACDLPSGADADTGAVPGDAVRADVTVTLGAHKRGLWLWPARGCCGRLVLGELGITDAPAQRTHEDGPPSSVDPAAALVPTAADVAHLVPAPVPDDHKYTRGVVLVVAGSTGMAGAATLVARGAMAAGAGLVVVATAAAVRDVVAAAVPEALTVALPDADADAAWRRLAEPLARADAVAVGPGLGHAAPSVEFVRRLVAEVDVPLVLDADGLNAYRHDGDALAGHVSPLLVLTPHEREFARLMGADAAALWPRRIEVVPAQAAAWDATILAKGPSSVVAAPDGRVWVNATGGAALATGGTGDVLTGLVAGLVATRPTPASAAAATWLGGRAGELATLGPHAPEPARRDPGALPHTGRPARAVTAGAVAAAVPSVFAELEQEVAR